MKLYKFLTYDIECKNKIDKTFMICGFYNGFKYKYFLTMQDFLDYILTPRYAGINIFAHAGGRFDIRYILSEMDYLRENFFLSFISISSSIVLTLQSKINKKLKWTFADSFLLFFASLKKIGSEMALNVRKADHDHDKNFLINPENIEYNKIDCVTLYEAIEKFSSLLKISKPRLTLAATALHVYRKKFFDFSILKTTRVNIEKFVRSAYFGGRVEIFKPDMNSGYCYDFNSLYPSCMLESMPAGAYVYVKKRDENKIGFYKAKIFVSDMQIPCMPYRAGKLIFPTGSWTGVFSGVELDLLKKTGGSYYIKKGIEFEKKENYFADYVNYFYEMKKKNKKSNPALYYVSKLMLNSLYGKFAQRREVQKIFLLDKDDKKIKKMTGIYDFYSDLYFQDSITKTKNIKPYISAHITALARVKLWNLMNDVGFEHIYYCDTDSIYTDIKYEKNINDDLGGLKLEHTCKNYHFILPKFYWGKNIDDFENETRYLKMKGYDRNIVQNLDDEFIVELSKGQKSITNVKLAGIKECIRSNSNLIGDGFFKDRIEIKSVISEYDKRIFVENNNSIPLKIENNAVTNLPAQKKKKIELFTPAEKYKYDITDDLIASILPVFVDKYELENLYNIDPAWSKIEVESEIKERHLNITIKKLSREYKRNLILQNIRIDNENNTML